jgi:hypothetical protein
MAVGTATMGCGGHIGGGVTDGGDDGGDGDGGGLVDGRFVIPDVMILVFSIEN